MTRGKGKGEKDKKVASVDSLKWCHEGGKKRKKKGPLNAQFLNCYYVRCGAKSQRKKEKKKKKKKKKTQTTPKKPHKKKAKRKKLPPNLATQTEKKREREKTEVKGEEFPPFLFRLFDVLRFEDTCWGVFGEGGRRRERDRRERTPRPTHPDCSIAPRFKPRIVKKKRELPCIGFFHPPLRPLIKGHFEKEGKKKNHSQDYHGVGGWGEKKEEKTKPRFPVPQ